jgi:hypothetical protein
LYGFVGKKTEGISDWQLRAHLALTADLEFFYSEAEHFLFQSFHLPVFGDGFEINGDDFGKLRHEDLHDLRFGHGTVFDSVMEILIAVNPAGSACPLGCKP